MTNERDRELVKRVHERYPEGLTGAILVGATRTSYILERNRHLPNPGALDDFEDYLNYAMEKNWGIVQMFLELGGHNLILTASSFALLENKRGPEHAAQISASLKWLINDVACAFYREHQMDPYFSGLDTLLRLPEDTPQHQAARLFVEFTKTWDYQPQHRKLIWEVAPIPLYIFYTADDFHGGDAQQALDYKIENEQSASKVYELLYQYYSEAAYGVNLPRPHFYLASNRNGDLKARSIVPFSMDAIGEMRMYFTPYPSLLMTKDTLRAIIEDLLVDKRIRSSKHDYSGQLTSEQAQKMYDYYTTLAADPTSTVGFTRTPFSENNDD